MRKGGARKQGPSGSQTRSVAVYVGRLSSVEPTDEKHRLRVARSLPAQHADKQSELTAFTEVHATAHTRARAGRRRKHVDRDGQRRAVSWFACTAVCALSLRGSVGRSGSRRPEDPYWRSLAGLATDVPVTARVERCPRSTGRDFVRPEFIAMLNDAGGPCWSYGSRAGL